MSSQKLSDEEPDVLVKDLNPTDTLSAKLYVRGITQFNYSVIPAGYQNTELGEGKFSMKIFYTTILCAILSVISSAGELDVKLAKAAGNGDIEQIRDLLDKGANINFHHENTDTALDYALDNRYLEAAEFLLQKGANPNFTDANKNCAFFISAEMDQLDSMKLLHTYGGRHQSSHDGTRPIHQATRHNNLDMIDFLLDNGHADINDCIYDTKKKIHYNPLMQAMGLDTEKDDTLYGFPNYNLMSHLLEKGASINAKCQDKTPLEIAKELGNATLIAELNDYNDIPIRKRLQKWIVANYPQRHNGKTVIEATSDQCTINYYPLDIYLPGIQLNFRDPNRNFKIGKEEIIPGETTEKRVVFPTMSIPVYDINYTTQPQCIRQFDIDTASWYDVCKDEQVQIENKVANISLPVDPHLKKATAYKRILEDYVNLCSSDKNISGKAEKRSGATEYAMASYNRWTYLDGYRYMINDIKEENKKKIEEEKTKIDNYQLEFFKPQIDACGPANMDFDDPFANEIINNFLSKGEYAYMSPIEKDKFFRHITDQMNQIEKVLIGEQEDNEEDNENSDLEDAYNNACKIAGPNCEQAKEKLEQKIRYKMQKKFVKIGSKFSTWKEIKKTIKIINELKKISDKVDNIAKNIHRLNEKLKVVQDYYNGATYLLDINKNLKAMDAYKQSIDKNKYFTTSCEADKLLMAYEGYYQSAGRIIEDLKKLIPIAVDAIPMYQKTLKLDFTD